MIPWEPEPEQINAVLISCDPNYRPEPAAPVISLHDQQADIDRLRREAFEANQRAVRAEKAIALAPWCAVAIGAGWLLMQSSPAGAIRLLDLAIWLSQNRELLLILAVTIGLALLVTRKQHV